MKKCGLVCRFRNNKTPMYDHNGHGKQDQRYTDIDKVRLSRMSASDRAEIEALSAVLDDAAAAQRDQAFVRFGALMGKADAYDPLPDSGDPVEIRGRYLRRRLAGLRRAASQRRITATRRAHRVPGGSDSRQLRPASGRWRTGTTSWRVERFSLCPARRMRSQAVGRTARLGRLLPNTER